MPSPENRKSRRRRKLCIECSKSSDAARCPDCKARERERERKANRTRVVAGRPGTIAAGAPRLPERERDLLIMVFSDGLAGKQFRPGGREFRAAAMHWIREIERATRRTIRPAEAAGLLADQTLLARTARRNGKPAPGLSPSALRVARILVTP